MALESEPLSVVLETSQLGTVTGGGSMMNSEKQIEFVGIDVQVYQLQESLELLSNELRSIGAPKDTVILYGEDQVFPVWTN